MTSPAPTHNTRVADFSGLWIPLITPFRNGEVDHPALDALVRRLRGDGVSGFVACGSTGEAAALDEAEQWAVLQTILHAAGPSPVVMGLSGYHLPKTVAWIQRLAALPIAGLLVAAPHYIRPTQAGLLHWFHTFAEPNPGPVKAMLAQAGAIDGTLRAPMTTCLPSAQAMAALGG